MLEGLEDRLLFARVLGIDISSHQSSTVNWTEVKTGNGTTAPAYGWVLAKASEGTQFTDPNFQGYMSGAHAAGIPSGGYDFARWDYNTGNSGADTEAAFFWARVQPAIANGFMMPMLDIEWAGTGTSGVAYSGVPTQYGYTKTTFSQWVLRLWTDIVTDGKNAGYTLTPLVYSGGSFAADYMDPTILAKVPLIVAQYPSGSPNPQVDNPSTSGGWPTWSAWQYTDGSTTVNNGGYVYGLGGTGVTGKSDADVLQGDVGELQNFVIGSPGRFVAGTPITIGNEIGSSATLYSNSDATSAEATGTVPIGTTGVITVDPATGLTHAFGSGFWNWYVVFSNGQKGWVHDYETPQSPSPHALMDWLQAGMVTNISSTEANGTYGTGTVIPINVAFNRAMTVTGSPFITLSDGGIATYASGSGSTVLTFNYTVASGQTSSDLDLSNGWDAINLNLGTIKDSLGNYPDLMTATPGAAGSLGANKNIIIDTSATTVTGVSSTTADGTYGIGAIIAVTVSFSDAVNVTGTPTLALNDGGTANYASGSGTSTLTFSYIVASGQSTSDLDEFSTTALALNGGTIKKTSTNNSASLTLPSPGTTGSLGANKAIVIDAAPAAVINATSNTPNGTYTVGRTIPITLTFSKTVTVTGTPQLQLNDGATVNFVLGNGSSVTFAYLIASGQNTPDLDYASPSALTLNGGTIKDSQGNDATLVLAPPGSAGSIGANKDIVIDTTAPTITNVTSTADNGSYIAGALIPITVQFSGVVNVTGIPQLTLNSGATVNYASGSGSNTLTFDYTVGADENSSVLDYATTTALALNGGTIKDAAGNGATLTLSTPGSAGSLGANKTIVVDTTAPAASYGGQTPNVGDNLLTFTVVYSDALTGVAYTTLDSSDVTVSGPNGFSANATFVGVDVSSNGSPRTATYSISAPGGRWDAGDDGSYTVSQNANQVKDAAGNSRPFGAIGTFIADLPFAYLSGTMLNIDYAAGQSSVTLSDDGSGNMVLTEGSSLSFASSAFSGVQIHDVSGGSDAMVIATALTKPWAFDGLAANDAVTIADDGSYTFAADAGAKVGLTISAGGSATFSAVQHLSSLTIDGNASVIPGQSVTIVTKALSVTGKLDLADGAIAVSYTASSPLGAWNGSAYTGITGWIASGRNGGTWDGSSGIVTSMSPAAAPNALATVGAAEASSALAISGSTTAIWRGETIGATTVLISYTYNGDANLDGVINGDDYFNIDSHVGLSGGAVSYLNGDFNYDGRVDADDYFVIDSNYGHAQSPAAGGAVVQAYLPAQGEVRSPAVVLGQGDDSAYRRLIEDAAGDLI